MGGTERTQVSVRFYYLFCVNVLMLSPNMGHRQCPLVDRSLYEGVLCKYVYGGILELSSISYG